MNTSTRHAIARGFAALGVGAIAVTAIGASTTGAAFASEAHATPARDAYIGVLHGVADSLARDVATYEKCAAKTLPFADGDSACKGAPGNVFRMIDLQAAALDRLTNPHSKTYVGPPPADLAGNVAAAEKAASKAWAPVGNANFSCRDYGCDSGKYRDGLQAAKTYSTVLAPWRELLTSSNRVINGCEIKPGTKCPGVDLSGQDLSDANLTGADLTGANLTGTNFDGAQLSGAILNKVTAIGAKFPEARMIKTELNGAKLGDADFYRTQLGEAILTGADLTHTNFDHTLMNKTAMNRATGSSENFSSAQMVGADVTGASLRGADFTNANLRGLDFSKNTDVSGAKFNGATCPSGSKAAGTPERCADFG